MSAAYGIDLSRFPWSRPLVTACLRDYASVAGLFAGNPRDPLAWRRTIAAVQGATRDHAGLGELLRAQLARRGAPGAALENAAALSDPRTVAIVTGQQAGLFGGPLYTLLKAVTAVQLARRVEREHGVRTVPVFWVEAEDHDWKEIRSVDVLDQEHNLREVIAPDLPGGGRLPVYRLLFASGIAATLSDLVAALPPTGFTNDLEQRLARHYRPGTSVALAFAGLMDELLGSEGLVVFEAYDPAAKPLVSDLFVGELTNPGRTAASINDAARTMKALGHAPQIEATEEGVALFYLGTEGRLPIRRRGATFVVGDMERTEAALLEEAESRPEQFSPNVFLRPLVQDRLLPTVCYVAGPAELAYQAQLGGLYKAFGVEAPLLMPRVSATILDSAAARFLERHELSLEALAVPEDKALSDLVERSIPAGVEQAIREMENALADRGQTVKSAILSVDPTLAGAVDTTLDKMRDTLQSLHNKIVQAGKRNDETLRRQFKRTYALVYPGGGPQERVLGAVFFLNRYGPALVQELLQTLPLETDQHYVVTI